ncbi:Uncharacterised protein [Yersinia similis]|nr:Uncharacterised protein [Yersinia similis]
MGLGLEYWQHQALDFVLQDLKKIPRNGLVIVGGGVT